MHHWVHFGHCQPTLPRKVVATAMGLINAVGNLGGYFGPVVVGHFLKQSGGFVYGFGILGIALIVAAAMSFHATSGRAGGREYCKFLI